MGKKKERGSLINGLFKSEQCGVRYSRRESTEEKGALKGRREGEDGGAVRREMEWLKGRSEGEAES